MTASSDLLDILKPFYQRASIAEDRLAKLEASLTSSFWKQGTGVGFDSGNKELLKIVSELQSKLDGVKVEQVSEKEKELEEIEKLRAVNAKLKYRIIQVEEDEVRITCFGARGYLFPLGGSCRLMYKELTLPPIAWAGRDS
ncbi:hypothetical protein U1Q18_032395 [Sarracenia purpurea var. burkii]